MAPAIGHLLTMVRWDDSKVGGLEPKAKVVVITGNYGSGKTEVAVNWALWLRRAGHNVTIADLDVVNPYFRCREALEPLEAEGIRVLAPRGELLHAELPILLPEVRGAIEQPNGVTLLDVGGDDDGARVLAGLAKFFDDYDMVQVVNQRRPFTDTVEGCLKIQREIEAASHLRITGLINNAHLMDETDATVIIDGAEFTRAVGRAGAGQDLRFTTVEQRVAESFDVAQVGGSVLVFERLMLPPWKTGKSKLGSENFRLSPS